MTPLNGCKLAHDADGIPQALCRTCHPELIPTPDQRAAQVKAERVRLDAERAAWKVKQDHLRTLQALDKTLRRSDVNVEGSIGFRQAASYRRKLERMEAQAQCQ